MVHVLAFLPVAGGEPGEQQEDEGEHLEAEAGAEQHVGQVARVVLEAGARTLTARRPQDTLRVKDLTEVDRRRDKRCNTMTTNH